MSIKFRELWDNFKQYRIDGIWNQKRKGILFQLKNNMTFDYKHKIHAPWAYKEIVNNIIELDYNLYHLKMIHQESRKERANLYNKLDPDKIMQPIGYDYLNDVKDLKLIKIEFRRRYNYKLIPKKYKGD